MEVRPLSSLAPSLRSAIERGDGRTMCPGCAGGSRREVSLSIRPLDADTIKLSCWRSTCGYWAVVLLTDGVQYRASKQKEARVYDKPTRYLRDVPEMLHMLQDRYGLRESVMLRARWSVGLERGELVMPVYDRLGAEIGIITRTFTTPKWVDTFKNTARPWLAFWRGAGPCVLVEDMLSACRLNGLGYNAVALLGTSLNTTDVDEIKRFAPAGPWILALDNDAFEKSVRLAARFSHLLKLEPIPLDKDIKDVENDDAIRLLIQGP